MTAAMPPHGAKGVSYATNAMLSLTLATDASFFRPLGSPSRLMKNPACCNSKCKSQNANSELLLNLIV